MSSNANKALFAVLMMLALVAPSWAREAPPAAADPALEKKVMDLAKDLRCLVCQNESLADSQADLAADLREEIREKFAAGESRKQVIDYLTARYGDFVLYRPPLMASTLLLWFGPALLVLAGVIALARRVRRQRGIEPQLSDAERARAGKLLGE